MRKIFMVTLLGVLLTPVLSAQINMTIGSAECLPVVDGLPWQHRWDYSEAHYGIPSSALAPISGTYPITIDKIGWVYCTSELLTENYSLNIYMDEAPDTYDLGSLCTTPYNNTNLVASGKTLTETSPYVFMLTLDTPFIYTPGNALIISVCDTLTGHTDNFPCWAANWFTGNGFFRSSDSIANDCDMLTDEGDYNECTNSWATTVFSCASTGNVYELEMLSPDGIDGATGTVEPAPDVHSFFEGASISIAAYPAFASDFDYWELDGAWFSGELEETVLMDADHTLQAFFKPTTALSLPFSEDFSGVPEGELPANWTEAPSHSYCGVSNTNEAGGITPEMKFSPSTFLFNSIRLITPKIDGNAVPDILLTFKHFTACASSSPFHLHVQTSIDNGVTWVNRYSLEVQQNIGPETVTIELDDLVGKEFHVSFVFDGFVVNSSKWHIDDVVIISDYKGLLKGVVTNDREPIEGAVITVVETGISAVTGPTGEYELRHREGNFTIECKAPGHYSEIAPAVEIIKNDVVYLDFCLTYPLANIHPTSFSVEQYLGESTDEYLYVENIGTGPLDFRINIDYSNKKRSSRGIGDWLALSPIATLVDSPSSCFGDGKFFVIGGTVAGAQTIFNAIQIYDTLLGTWSESSPMIEPVYNSVAEYYEGKVYVIGGTTSVLFQTSDTVQIYDVSSDTWSKGASMPTPRTGASSGLIDGKIYSLCGSTSSAYPPENVAYEYDIADNTWATLTSGPIGGETVISHGGGCAFNGRIYVGGHPATYNQFYEFDPAGGGAWTAKAMIPDDLGGYKLRMVGLETEGFILAVGSYDDDDGPTGSTWSYDPETDTWTNLDKPMTTAVVGGACAAGYGKIYYYGGYGRSDHLEPAPFMMNTFYDPFWLSADIIWGSVDPGDAKIVTLTFDADEVSLPGMYSTELAIIHNTDDGTLLTIPATMLVKSGCDYLGSRLAISQEDPFRAGDMFWLKCHVCNNTVAPMQQIATAVVLGVYGEFWFWPGWSQDFDLEYHDYLPGLTEIQVFEFIWPDVQGTALGLEFYSGLINAEMNDLIGEYGYLTFGYTTSN